MTPAAELEIGIHAEDADTFAVELRFRRADDDADPAPVRGRTRLEPDALLELWLDPVRYGQRLWAQLFADPAVLGAFEQALAAAGGALRLRLFIGDAPSVLHGVRWETLRHPDDGRWLLSSEETLFSRLLGSPDWRPVRLGPKRDLRALAVVASPLEVAAMRLASIDVAGEIARARAGLGDIPVQVLASDPAAGRRVTLDGVLDALAGGHDILYLVCHGMLRKDGSNEPILVLEKEDGAPHRALGAQLVDRVRDLPRRPSLVVLVSCQSAGTGEASRTGDDGALAALGPRLARAGVPAVVAMQGNVQMSTMQAFMPAFFAALRVHGEVDRAVAVARGRVRDATDAWMPALFMRLRSGRIWARTGADFRPSRWVLVAGIGNHDIPPGAVLAARQLGAELAERGYGLIVGGWDGVDYLAAEAFAAVMKAKRKPLSAALKQVVSSGKEPHFRGGDVIHVQRGVGEWVECLRGAAAAILVGGADRDHGVDGTYETYGYALQEQRPVFPFRALAGGSRRAYDEMLEDYEAQPLPGIPREEFVAALGGPLAGDEDVKRAIDGLMKMLDRCD